MNDYSRLIPEIQRMAGFRSARAIAAILGVPLQHVRTACRDGGITLPRSAPREGVDVAGYEPEEGRYGIAGFTGSSAVLNVRHADDPPGDHGPVRILMRDGVPCNFLVGLDGKDC